MPNQFCGNLDEKIGLPEIDLREYSPLVLAFIGDGIYELMLRTIIVKQNNAPVQLLHKRVSTLVKASAQAEMIEKIMPQLTEEEISIYKRGRNAKSYTKAKNASTSDYRRATGFEALMGYLYLKKDMDRITDLLTFCLEGKNLKQIDTHNHKPEISQ